MYPGLGSLRGAMLHRFPLVMSCLPGRLTSTKPGLGNTEVQTSVTFFFFFYHGIEAPCSFGTYNKHISIKTSKCFFFVFFLLTWESILELHRRLFGICIFPVRLAGACVLPAGSNKSTKSHFINVTIQKLFHDRRVLLYALCTSLHSNVRAHSFVIHVARKVNVTSAVRAIKVQMSQVRQSYVSSTSELSRSSIMSVILSKRIIHEYTRI